MDTLVAVKAIEGHDAIEEKGDCKVQDRKDEDWQVVLCRFVERIADFSYIFGRIRVLALLGPLCKRLKIN